MSEQTVYLEGTYVPLSEAKIPVMDHGLLYGDGIFEGIRAYGGRVFRLDDHMKRFQSAAKAINLTLPISIEEVTEVVLETCRRNAIVDGYVRLVCTRGADGLGLYPKPGSANPRLFCIAGQVALYSDEAYRRGLKVITSHLRRNKATIVDPQIKSLNYLNNILASIEAHRSVMFKGYPDYFYSLYWARSQNPEKSFMLDLQQAILSGNVRDQMIDLVQRIHQEFIDTYKNLGLTADHYK